MKADIKDLTFEVVNYFAGAYFLIKPHFIWGTAILSFLTYVFFPKEVYVTYAEIVGGTVLLDLLTKQYSIIVKNGGIFHLFRIIRERKLSSHQFWQGTRKKIISYLFVMILVGLSARFSVVESFMVFAGNVVYALMFIREATSICENMTDAGYDMSWILPYLQRKQEQLYNDNDKTEQKIIDKSQK